MAMKMSKLKKMKMPEKKGEDLSHMEEGSADEEALESPAEEASEDEGMEDLPSDEMDPMDKGAEGPSEELAHVDDEALLAEIKKRGLMDKLKEEDMPGKAAEKGEAEADDDYMA